MKLLTIVFLLIFTGIASAQTTTVDLNKATMTWSWASTGEAALGFRMKCGKSTGAYSILTDIADPAARTIGVKGVIGGSGSWFCAVAAYNAFGESLVSNEISFTAGATPSGSIVLAPPK